MCAARRAVCAARTPRPAPRAPAPAPAPAPAWPGRTHWAPQVSAGSARPTAAPAPARAPHQPCAQPASPPRPDPRRAPLPASAPSSRLLLLQKKSPFWFTAFAPPRSALPGPGCSPCPASGDRWVATGLQVLVLTALARPGEWPESAAAPSSPEAIRDPGDPRWWRDFSFYSGDHHAFTPDSDL